MRRVVVETRSANEIRDLASVRRDFLLASTFLEFYETSNLEAEGQTPAPIDALWIAAVTMYGRAFATGHRQSGRPLVPTAEPAQADHQYFFDLRNKYIAHSANGFERSTVFADLLDPAYSLGISKIGEYQVNLNRLSRDASSRLLRLCRDQIDAITDRIEELHQDVAAELLEMGADATYELPDFVEPRLDGSNPRSPRR